MMETHEGKTVPIVKEFQIQGSWTPVTPVKPILPRPRPIYEDGQGGVLGQAYMRESEDYLSRFSHQNQAHTLLSCSISSAGRGNPYNSNTINSHNNNNDNTTIWDDPHGSTTPLPGRINLQRENGESQRRGLEDYLPHWSSQGKRRMPSSFGTGNPVPSNYPSFSSWESPLSWKNNGLRENDSMLQHNNSHDPLAQFDNLSFGELLAANGSALEPSVISSSQGDTGGAPIGSIYSGWNTQPQDSRFDSSAMYRNQDSFPGLNQQINGICVQEMHGAFPHQLWSNINSPPSTKHANGKNSTFAPPTPDLQSRAESNVASGNAIPGLNQRPDEQNGLQEHEAAVAMINLHDLNHKDVTEPTTDSSLGKVSAIVEENQNPEKEADQIIDLNKTPQKKPRRKRYMPKVVNENKPKRTPKPKTPKPTDAKENPKPKRKYVRKNKSTPSTTSPEGTTEPNDPKPTEPKAKSCKKSLNFDLNGQVPEHNSVPMSKDGSCADPNDSHVAGNQSSNTVDLRQGEELMVKSSQVGIAYDLNCSLSQELRNYISLPEKVNLDDSQPDHTVPTEGNEKATSSSLGPNAEVPSRADACLAQSPNSSPCTSSNEAVQARGSKRGHSSVHDTTDVDAGNLAANSSKSWHTNDTFLGDGNTKGVPTFPFTGIHKKKRTEKGQRSHTSSTSSSVTASEDFSQAANIHIHPRVDPAASKYYYCNPASYGNNLVTNSQVQLLMRSEENRAQLLNTWVDIARLKKKKRTKGATRVRDLAPLKGIASVSPAKPAMKRPGRRKNDTLNKPCPGTGNMNLSNGVHSCMEALSEDTHGTPRSKRRYRKQNSAINSRTYKVNQPLELVLYDGNQAIRNTTVPVSVVPWVNVSVEAITEGMKRLDINRKGRKISRQEQKALVPYNVNNQAQNAIVPYENNGTIVPFEPRRRRRQRAKVDLDDETTRVWRLLLENIDNKGIDGTDEEKAKWWENERSVFQGRVDSFIARMRLVQGDRRFTPWKGSVLDSVIGVFLTQNVSDHLSSSAFMSLAARFPLKPENTESALSEEASSALVAEPNFCVIDAEESITWIEKPLDQPICDMDSRIIPEIEHSEEREVVNSKEMIGGAPGSASPIDYSSESSQKAPIEIRVHNANSQTTETEAASIVGDDRARDDATSSQQSVISSQNSVNSPNLQTKGMMGTFSENNSRAQNSSNCNYYHCSSFTGLLKMAEAPFHYGLMGQLECMNHVVKDSPEAPGISVNDYQLHLKTDFHLQGTRCSELLEVESRSSNTSRKDENSTTEISNLSTESTVQHLVMDKSSDGIQRPFAENVSSCYVLEGENMVIQSEGRSMKEIQVNVSSSAQAQTSSIWGHPNLLKSLQHNDDVTESTTALVRKNNEQKENRQKSGHNHVSDGVSDISNVDPSKPKKGRAGKEKKNPYNWDNLRKEAQVNGIKRERTANTRDSLDWEAVRHANVHEIADTIKERGMNNMLAERIKDLLDRLVKDHGSVDMEWLRDIPPDKAKEYLLSFRGLGLKSVECVRLLTLHHLAFPVDTNVGRIAVRLGWVPLQPLPESLQLHLLELYPVLESIQKYLWPRLCKLDQKTLYELHYHMITFGKVFCTKRQPNCNACPLRGECRHFASAFASARLALPGPEERSLMPSAGSNSAHLHPQANINPLPLPPSWSNQHQNTNFGSNKYPPMIEVPSTPLSLPLPQTIHHLQRPSQINCEPIVEVPASPEPEPEPEQEHTLGDIEDTFYEDPDEIPTIKLNMKQFTQTLQNFMQANKELQETGMSRALVALTPDTASIPTPKLKNISRLRTEHHVYELPDTHPLLKNLDKREPDDPCSYLLAIWTPGETADSIQPPERRCNFEDPGILCNEETCSYCSSQREANSQIVRATLLIPCRTAMRGSFPLNGTYFQVNEVFADHESSLNPLHVSRELLWNLPRRTVYFGTSIPTIFRGLTTEDIQHCFWRGYVCVRGFDQKTRAPRPLMARLHFPASRMPRGAKGKPNDE